jgi:hypothetical protein
VLSIVALHGMNGHAFDTWRFSEAEADSMWLRDFLPDKVPRARILTYGYQAYVFANSTGMGGFEHLRKNYLKT